MLFNVCMPVVSEDRCVPITVTYRSLVTMYASLYDHTESDLMLEIHPI